MPVSPATIPRADAAPAHWLVEPFEERAKQLLSFLVERDHRPSESADDALPLLGPQQPLHATELAIIVRALCGPRVVMIGTDQRISQQLCTLIERRLADER